MTRGNGMVVRITSGRTAAKFARDLPGSPREFCNTALRSPEKQRMGTTPNTNTTLQYPPALGSPLPGDPRSCYYCRLKSALYILHRVRQGMRAYEADTAYPVHERQTNIRYAREFLH